MRVRGLRASISASTSRLNAIAAERAPTMATQIQTSFQPTARRLSPTWRIASSAPVRAKGREQKECSNLIISSVNRIRLESISASRHYFNLGDRANLGWDEMLECFALSDPGCVRGNNEDYCLVRPEIGLYALADGMGGAKAGERASRLAVETVENVVDSAPKRDSQALLRAVEEANQRVLQASQSDPELEGMGTTLVVALESGDTLDIASVGDSRAYLLDEDGFRAI